MGGGVRRHPSRDRPGEVAGEADGRLRSPSFPRNFEPIRDGLAALLEGRDGAVLEIGAGTGQHAAHLAAALAPRPWQPTDIDDVHLASIAAWRAHLGVPGRCAPLRLDATADWEAAARGPLAAVYAQNVIHIAPWAVAEAIVAGAARALGAGGLLILYGPFREGGRHTGEGNARFDAVLRAENPAWGVRDLDAVTALAAAAGFGAPEIRRLPSNNLLVAFARA